jgi:hypothetical protein
VTRDEYARLPEQPARDRPARGDERDEWFHADVHAAPAPTRGGAAATIATSHARVR